MKQKNKAQAKAKGKGKGKKRKAKAKAKAKAFTPSDDEGSQISKKQRVKDDEAKSTLQRETGDDSADVQYDVDMIPPVPPPADPALSHGSDSHHDSKPPSSSCRAPAAARVNRTPEEIFRMMVPNRDFVIHLKYNDWRLESQCRLVLAPKDSSRLYSPYSQKTFSIAFISLPWKDALTDVHDFTWRKWRLLKHLSPLGEGFLSKCLGKSPRHVWIFYNPS